MFFEEIGYDLLNDHIKRRIQQDGIPKNIRSKLINIEHVN